MRVKENLILKEMGTEYVVVPVGEGLLDFQVMLTLNDTGAFLWNALKEETTFDNVVSDLTKEYDVAKETAEQDIKEFIDILSSKDLIVL